MKTCVLDLEMDQPSNEIIQIGAVALDVKQANITDKFNIYIKINKQLNPVITQLTGITDDILNTQGVEYPFALQEFWAWMRKSGCGKNLSSWGNDYWQIINDSKTLNIDMPKYPRCLNIKEMASVLRCSFPSAKSRGGLSNTLALFNLEFKGTPHNALDDAWNTAKLLSLFQRLTSQALQVKYIVR